MTVYVAFGKMFASWEMLVHAYLFTQISLFDIFVLACKISSVFIVCSLFSDTKERTVYLWREAAKLRKFSRFVIHVCIRYEIILIFELNP